MTRLWGLWIAATLGLGAYGAMVLLDRSVGTLRAEYTPTTIALYLVAFVGFLVALWWNERASEPSNQPANERWTGRDPIPTAWFWGLPILFRVMLWLTEPTLSDDVYRYLWDGHLLSQGVNPYSYAISATEVDRYEIVARTLANNPDLSSPYLPAAQFLFAAMAVVGLGSPLAMQVVMTVFDVLTAVLISKLLPMAGLPARRALLYLWNPLVIVELAHGAHIDAFMIALTTLSIYAAMKRARSLPSPVSSASSSRSCRPWFSWLSPVALALAALTRPVPLLLAPVLWWRWSWLQRALFGAVLAVLVIPFGFGPAGWGLSDDAPGTGVFGSARVYSQEFRFNAVISAWLERLLGDSASALSVTTSLVMAALGVIVWLMARPGNPASGTQRSEAGNASEIELADRENQLRRSMRLMAVLTAGYVLLTPVLHPWYLALMITLLPFLTPSSTESADRWLSAVPWLYLSGAISLSYVTYLDPDAFGELEWVRRVEWFPFLGLLAVAAGARILRRGPGVDSELERGGT